MSDKALWADLLLAVLWLGVAAVLVVWLPDVRGAWRVALGLSALLLVPGYLMTVVLFPGRAALGGLDRAVLSLGYSLIAVPLLGLLLSALPPGVTPGSMARAVYAWSLVWAVAAWWRRRGRPLEQLFLPARNLSGARVAAPFFVVGLGAIVGLGSLVGGLRAGVPLTEFYVLGAQGRLGDYPIRLAPGRPVSLTLAVHNLEGRAVSYRIEPSRCSGTVSVPRLASGQEWRAVWTCRPSAPVEGGALRFDLYREGDRAPYRTLSLTLE